MYKMRFCLVLLTLVAMLAFTSCSAIIFGSGHVPIVKMVKAGIILNLVGVVLIAIFIFTLALPIFDITVDQFPTDWLKQAPPGP